MNIARLNFSHGDHKVNNIKFFNFLILIKSQAATLKNLRAALKLRPQLNCAVMLDTKGPEIRTGFLDGVKTVEFKKDQLLEISNK